MSDYLKFIGIVLSDRRRDRKLSQKDVARRSGLGFRTVAEYECGYRIRSMKLSYIDDIASALGTSGLAVLTEAQCYARELG